MPKVLDRCVQKLKAKGYTEEQAYAICVKSTSWKRKRGGGWTMDKAVVIQEPEKRKLTAEQAEEYLRAFVENLACYLSNQDKNLTPELVARKVWRRIVLDWRYDDFLFDIFNKTKVTKELVEQIVNEWWNSEERGTTDMYLSVPEKLDLLKSKDLQLHKGLIKIKEFLGRNQILIPRDEFKRLVSKFVKGNSIQKSIKRRKDVSPAVKERALEEYGEGVPYADETNKKYPLDKEHIHAAISYFGMPKNYEKYPAEDRKKIARKILKYAKKHGVEIDEENWKKKFNLEG